MLWGLDLLILLPQGGMLTHRSLREPGAVAIRMLSGSHGCGDPLAVLG